jgi:hypothetical protein
MQSANDVGVDAHCKGVRDAKRLEWIPREKLRNPSFVEADLHPYVEEQLSHIVRCEA